MTDSVPPSAPAKAAKFKLSRKQLRGLAAGAAVVLVLVIVLTTSVLWGLPLSRSLEPMTNPTLVLVSDDGRPFARRGSYKEAPVDAGSLPAHVKHAFIAIEDRRFYRHGGLDLRAIGRAMTRNMKSGELSEGGSTITQQLAKNAFTSGKRTFRRKTREAVIAVYIEGRLSKDEILSRYMSSVYFGDGVFGLRGAARHYFNKAPEALTIGEAAMLAGLVKAPTRLAPTEDLDAAKARQRLVLAAMREIGAITPEQAQAARQVKLRDGRPELPVGSWFADWVSPQAKRAFDRAYGEVKVRTTLDAAIQTHAEKTLARVLQSQGGKVNATQGALVAMHTDGRVVALVGGKDYRQSQFNRAVQAERQPGSAFKPFVYLAAIRRGATPDSMVIDAPIKVGGWKPQNHEARYTGGPITLRQAFARSSNVAAVRLAQETGRGAIVQAARDLGIKAELPNDATIALGTANLTLLELTSAYAGIAGGEGAVTAYGLTDDPPNAPHRPMPRHERQAMLQLLRSVVTSGTGGGANIQQAAFGKTGTSQDYRDAYFVGFVGDLVIGVWIGNDDNTPMRKVVGGSLPTQIWRDVMNYAISRGEVVDIQLLDAAQPEAEYAFLDPDAPWDIPVLEPLGPVIERRDGETQDADSEIYEPEVRVYRSDRDRDRRERRAEPPLEVFPRGRIERPLEEEPERRRERSAPVEDEDWPPAIG